MKETSMNVHNYHTFLQYGNHEVCYEKLKLERNKYSYVNIRLHTANWLDEHTCNEK
mgnify:CR=1 FL=1